MSSANDVPILYGEPVIFDRLRTDTGDALRSAEIIELLALDIARSEEHSPSLGDDAGSGVYKLVVTDGTERGNAEDDEDPVGANIASAVALPDAIDGEPPS